MRACYYGVWTKGIAGHGLHAPGGSEVMPPEWFTLPFHYSITDSGLIPVRPHHRGPYFAQVNGWTFLSYLDQTGDTRPGSCSVFILEGLHTEAEAKRIASEMFLGIWCRMFGERVIGDVRAGRILE